MSKLAPWIAALLASLGCTDKPDDSDDVAERLWNGSVSQLAIHYTGGFGPPAPPLSNCHYQETNVVLYVGDAPRIDSYKCEYLRPNEIYWFDIQSRQLSQGELGDLALVFSELRVAEPACIQVTDSGSYTLHLTTAEGTVVYRPASEGCGGVQNFLVDGLAFGHAHQAMLDLVAIP